MSEPFPTTPPRRLAEVASFLRADAARYAERGGWARNPGFWVGATHRLSEWARLESRPLRRYALRLPLAGLTKLWRASLGVAILDGAAFGPGLCLPRARALLIGRVHTGRDVLISDHVTIGTNANSDEFAVIGSEVDRTGRAHPGTDAHWRRSPHRTQRRGRSQRATRRDVRHGAAWLDVRPQRRPPGEAHDQGRRRSLSGRASLPLAFRGEPGTRMQVKLLA